MLLLKKFEIDHIIENLRFLGSENPLLKVLEAFLWYIYQCTLMIIKTKSIVNTPMELTHACKLVT